MTYRNGTDVGAAAELIAAADLLQRGYSVYRSVSSSAPFDLAIAGIALRPVTDRRDPVLRVEVKAPKLGTWGNVVVPTQVQWNLFDLMALVLRDEEQVLYLEQPFDRNHMLLPTGEVVEKPAKWFTWTGQWPEFPDEEI